MRRGVGLTGVTVEGTPALASREVLLPGIQELVPQAQRRKVVARAAAARRKGKRMRRGNDATIMKRTILLQASSASGTDKPVV